jgi:chromate reductase, NAD(P)H dehydrogenase (quinone)
MARNVAVLVGSLRDGSLSRKTALALAEMAKPRLDLSIVEIGSLPLYNPDLDTDSRPAEWQSFRGQIQSADAVLFVTPEYNRSVPAGLKNALDVASRPYGKSSWNGKPGAIVSVSPGLLGAFGANHHLRQSLVFLNIPVLQQPEAYLSNAASLFGEDGQISKGDTSTFLATFLDAFRIWIDLHVKD